MAKQKILTMITLQPNLRSSAEAWGEEDGDKVIMNKEIGFSDCYRGPYSYACPLFAIGDGWRLMAPPVEIKDYTEGVDAWDWWFEK